MQPSLLPGDAQKQPDTEQYWLTRDQQVPCQTFRKGSPRLRGMQLGFQILAWALRLLKRTRFFKSVTIKKKAFKFILKLLTPETVSNIYEEMCWSSYMERSIPRMCRGGLSVEGERCGVSACFTQPCSILPLLQGWKAVGQSSGDFCLNLYTSPHRHGRGMGSGGGRSHSRGQEDHGSGRLVRPPRHSRITMVGQQPPRSLSSPTTGKWHHLKLAQGRRWLQTQNCFMEPVVKECGAKKIPSEGLSPVLDVG